MARMTIGQLITKLNSFNPEAEALVIVRCDEANGQLVLTDDPDGDPFRFEISSVVDGGWENPDGTSPIIDVNLGELVMS